MTDFNEMFLMDDINKARKLTTFVRWTKILLALVILWAYFFDATWLVDAIVCAVVFCLILPLGFFGLFFMSLLEYNLQMIEKRQLLNAREANEHFAKLYRKIGE